MHSSCHVTLGSGGIALLAEVCCVGGKQARDSFLVSQTVELVVLKCKSKFES